MSESLVIGRASEQFTPDISVDDEYVSTQHAVVTRRDDGTIWIEDCGSMNGTWLNGVRVYTSRQAHAGDRLRVGRTEVALPAALWRTA